MRRGAVAVCMDREKLRTTLEDVGEKIERLSKEAKDEYREQLRSLKEKRNDLRARFEEVKDASDDAWARVEAEWKRSVASLRTSYEDLKNRM